MEKERKKKSKKKKTKLGRIENREHRMAGMHQYVNLLFPSKALLSIKKTEDPH